MFERVYTMTDFYDGPRGGVADYRGRPHLYESTFDNNGYNETFRLSPVSQDLLELALEDWQIWLRWEKAFHNDETTHDTHPALPEDRKRHDELEVILSERLVIDESNYISAYGKFVHDGEQLQVEWSPT